MRAAALMLATILLTGCASRPSTPKAAPKPEQMILATNLSEETAQPLVSEFESRTGIWVTVRYGSSRQILDLAREGQCDLLLGLGADTLEANREIFTPLGLSVKPASWVSTGSNWVPVFATRAVIIYNRQLVQQNAPKDFEDLLDPMWRGQIAFADPKQSDFSAMTLTVLGGESQAEIENRLTRFAGNVGVLLDRSRYAVDEVVKGNACLAVVTSQMISDRPHGSVGTVHPEGGDMLFTEAAAIPKDAANSEQALKMLEFLLQEDVQDYAARNGDGISVLDEAGHSAGYDSRRAGQNLWAVLDSWEHAWEAVQ